MTFQYDPTLAYSCFPPGKYPATLVDVNEGISKKGLPLLTLVFEVRSGARRRKIRGWVANPTSLFMLKEFAYAVERGPDFDAGRFDAEACLGATVIVELSVTVTDGWGEQNAIDHYHRCEPDQSMKPGTTAASPNTPSTPRRPALGGDDIPF